MTMTGMERTLPLQTRVGDSKRRCTPALPTGTPVQLRSCFDSLLASERRWSGQAHAYRSQSCANLGLDVAIRFCNASYEGEWHGINPGWESQSLADLAAERYPSNV